MKRPVSPYNRKEGRARACPKPPPLRLPVSVMQAVLGVGKHALEIPTPKTLSAASVRLRRQPPTLALSGLPVPADPVRAKGTASSQSATSSNSPIGLGASPKEGSLCPSPKQPHSHPLSLLRPPAPGRKNARALNVQTLLTPQWLVIFSCQCLPSWVMRANCIALSQCPSTKTCK